MRLKQILLVTVTCFLAALPALVPRSVAAKTRVALVDAALSTRPSLGGLSVEEQDRYQSIQQSLSPYVQGSAEQASQSRAAFEASPEVQKMKATLKGLDLRNDNSAIFASRRLVGSALALLVLVGLAFLGLRLLRRRGSVVGVLMLAAVGALVPLSLPQFSAPIGDWTLPLTSLGVPLHDPLNPADLTIPAPASADQIWSSAAIEPAAATWSKDKAIWADGDWQAHQRPVIVAARHRLWWSALGVIVGGLASAFWLRRRTDDLVIDDLELEPALV